MFEASPMASFVFELRFWLGVPERGRNSRDREEALRAAKLKAMAMVAFLIIGLWMMKGARDCKFGTQAESAVTLASVAPAGLQVGAGELREDQGGQREVAGARIDGSPLIGTDADYEPPVPIQ